MNVGRKTIEVVNEIFEDADLLRASKDAGGVHEHAFWLASDLEELEKARDILQRHAESIRREVLGEKF